MGKIIEINTDYMEQPKTEGDLFQNRALLADMHQNTAEVSIVVVAYNRLEKTRRFTRRKSFTLQRIWERHLPIHL